jgi:CBS domain-containing protein
VTCVDASLSVDDAMGLVTRRRIRHLPVSDGSRVIGLVSIGDLVRWRIRDCEVEIDHLRNYFAVGDECDRGTFAPQIGATEDSCGVTVRRAHRATVLRMHPNSAP